MQAMIRVLTLFSALLALSPLNGYAESYAVVIAVSQYPNLPRHRQLTGPRHDAAAMIDFLRTHQGIERSRIIVLVDQLPDTDFAPTKTNILAAFGATALKLQVRDTVWLYFAGHGSQQPQPPNASTPEPDGLDEIFLPQDVGRWDGEIAAVQNAIVDDELADAISRIRALGANVIAVFDTCHAADSVRGPGGGETLRTVPAIELGVPATARKQPARKAPSSGRGEMTSKIAKSTNEPAASKRGHLTALYASATFESTPELRLPRWSPVGKKRGLFTYHLLEIWNANPELSPAAVIEKVRVRYRLLGRNSPTPTTESE